MRIRIVKLRDKPVYTIKSIVGLVFKHPELGKIRIEINEGKWQYHLLEKTQGGEYISMRQRSPESLCKSLNEGKYEICND